MLVRCMMRPEQVKQTHNDQLLFGSTPSKQPVSTNKWRQTNVHSVCICAQASQTLGQQVHQ
jgi:hypothetical protein